jgi:hypothetical protein
VPLAAEQEVERAIFDALLEAGADVDLQEDQGLTPVMLAVRKMSKQKAQWLIGGRLWHWQRGAVPRPCWFWLWLVQEAGDKGAPLRFAMLDAVHAVIARL